MVRFYEPFAMFSVITAKIESAHLTVGSMNFFRPPNGASTAFSPIRLDLSPPPFIKQVLRINVL